MVEVMLKRFAFLAFDLVKEADHCNEEAKDLQNVIIASKRLSRERAFEIREHGEVLLKRKKSYELISRSTLRYFNLCKEALKKLGYTIKD